MDIQKQDLAQTACKSKWHALQPRIKNRRVEDKKEPEKPVILDLESVRVIRPGQFEIDIVNLFSKRRPLIYKLEEGKYIIDLAASFKVSKEELDKKIRDPSEKVE